MRLRDEIIGALNLFDTTLARSTRASYASARPWPTSPPSDYCSNAPSSRRDTLTEQLQTALNSRVLIEQAKGVLAERLRLDVDDAFAVLRSGARSHNRRLSDLAQAIVDGSEQIPPARATSQPG